ncbi:hypothetical protein Tco_0741768 [Tanacetum coccineum]
MRYPDTEDLKPLNGHKSSEALTEKASFRTPEFVSPKSLCVKYVRTIFPSPPLVYTLPVTYPEEVEETIGIPMEVKPLDETQLEDLGLNTCNHDIPLSYREVPSFDDPEPQPQPLRNCPSLDVSLGDERGPQPSIKPLSPDSFRMKVVDLLTIHTPPSPHVTLDEQKLSYYPTPDIRYDNGKWKMMHPKVVEFYGVYHNITRMAISGPGDGDYTQKALVEFQVEYEVPFTLTHCWAELKDCSSSFNMSQSRVGSFNLNTHTGDDEEEDVQEVQRPMARDKAKNKTETSSTSSTSGNKDALAKLMVNVYVYLTQPYKERKLNNVEAFLEIRRRELELKAQRIIMREIEQRHQDLQFTCSLLII